MSQKDSYKHDSLFMNVMQETEGDIPKFLDSVISFMDCQWLILNVEVPKVW